MVDPQTHQLIVPMACVCASVDILLLFIKTVLEKLFGQQQIIPAILLSGPDPTMLVAPPVPKQIATILKPEPLISTLVISVQLPSVGTPKYVPLN